MDRLRPPLLGMSVVHWRWISQGFNQFKREITGINSRQAGESRAEGGYLRVDSSRGLTWRVPTKQFGTTMTQKDDMRGLENGR